MLENRNTFNKENQKPLILLPDKDKNQKVVRKPDQLFQKLLKDDPLKMQGLILPVVVSQTVQSNNNSQHVSEFKQNIREYLQQKECYYQVSPNYLDKQSDLNEKMRSILVDWLVEVDLKFKLRHETLFMTVNLVDRFLSREFVDRSKIQLVGISAIFIIAKFEEIYPPLLKDYEKVCNNAYTHLEILEMESRILISVNFNLTQTSSYSFLQHIHLNLDFDEKAKVLGRYIIENALYDISLLKYTNLVLAAGAVFLVFKIFKKGNWQNEFEPKVGVSEKIAKICAKDLFQMMHFQDKSSLVALKKKFMTIEYFEVAKYRIEKINKVT